jgi:hypothetical protein
VHCCFCFREFRRVYVLFFRQRELDEHALGAAWLERDCVSVDRCEQTSSNENPYFRTVVPKYGPPLFKARHQQQAA